MSNQPERYVILKVSYNEDIRRFRTNVNRFADLQKTVEELFNIPVQSLLIKYNDADNDKITISTDLELEEALRSANASTNPPTLRLFVLKKETPKPEAKKALHIGIRCDSCNRTPIIGDRWKCDTCPDYDLCSPCKESGSHSFHQFTLHKNPVPRNCHRWRRSAACPATTVTNTSISAPASTTPATVAPVVPAPVAAEVSEPVLHYGIACDVCSQYPIQGDRYKCITCEDYDLCQKCKDSNVHPQHQFKHFPLSEKPHWRTLLAAQQAQEEKEQALKEKESAEQREITALASEFVTDIPKEEERPFQCPKPDESIVIIDHPVPTPAVQPTPVVTPAPVPVVEQPAVAVPVPVAPHPAVQPNPVITPAPVVPAPAPVASHPYANELEQLRSMGFSTDEQLALGFLERFRGDLIATVNALLQL